MDKRKVIRVIRDFSKALKRHGIFIDRMVLYGSHASGQAISDADRLECMLFSEYEPYFEGDEPPGL